MVLKHRVIIQKIISRIVFNFKHIKLLFVGCARKKQSANSLPMPFGERGTAFARVSPCVRSCPVSRSFVPRPAFAKSLRDRIDKQ